MGGITGYPDLGSNGIKFGGPEYFEAIEKHFDDVIAAEVENASDITTALTGDGWGGRQVWVHGEFRPYFQTEAGGDFLPAVMDTQETSAPTIAAGWQTPSVNSLTERAGWISYSFNALATAGRPAASVVATMPADLKGVANVWATAWGVNGANAQMQVLYDAAANAVKLGNQGLTGTQGIALTLTWPRA